jgi:hypothetical protein
MERAREISAMPLAQMRELPTQELIQAYRLMRVHAGGPAAANLRQALYTAVGYRRFREITWAINREATQMARLRRQQAANGLDVASKALLQDVSTAVGVEDAPERILSTEHYQRAVDSTMQYEAGKKMQDYLHANLRKDDTVCAVCNRYRSQFDGHGIFAKFAELSQTKRS